jgi:malonate decarboxylase gamma subunit
MPKWDRARAVLADAVLASTRNHRERPIVMLVDTAGQRLSRRDELLASTVISAIAKYLKLRGAAGASGEICIRRSGERRLPVVRLMADEIFAGPMRRSG